MRRQCWRIQAEVADEMRETRESHSSEVHMSMKTYDIVIVGAGLSGLVAARDLSASGRSVLVLEARDRIGGRLFARTLRERTAYLDFGGNWIIPGEHATVEAELARYAIATVRSPDPDAYITLIEGNAVDKATLDEADQALLAQAFERARPVAKPEMSLLDVLQAGALPARLIKWIAADRRFLNGASLADVGGLRFIDQSPEMLASPDHYSTGIAGTTMSLVHAIASEAGAEVRLSTAVRQIAEADGELEISDAHGRTVRARQVIIASPLNTLNGIRFEPAIAAVTALSQRGHAGHSVKLWFTARNVEGYPRWMSDQGTACYVRVDRYLASGEALMVAFSDDQAAARITAEALQQDLRRFSPQIVVTSVDLHDWNADPASQGTWLAMRPGQSGPIATLARLDGNIRFIGSDFSQTAPGTIEGALRTGREAAASIIAKA